MRKMAEDRGDFADSGGYNLKAQTGEANNVKVVLFRDDGSQWTITSPKGTISDRGESDF